MRATQDPPSFAAGGPADGRCIDFRLVGSTGPLLDAASEIGQDLEVAGSWNVGLETALGKNRGTVVGANFKNPGIALERFPPRAESSRST